MVMRHQVIVSAHVIPFDKHIHRPRDKVSTTVDFAREDAFLELLGRLRIACAFFEIALVTEHDFLAVHAYRLRAVFRILGLGSIEIRNRDADFIGLGRRAAYVGEGIFALAVLGGFGRDRAAVGIDQERIGHRSVGGWLVGRWVGWLVVKWLSCYSISNSLVH